MARLKQMRTRNQVLLGLGVFLLLFVLLYAIFGSEGRNNAFQPQDEFKVTPWVKIMIGPLDLSITRAVLYVFLAATLATGTMVYIAKRMQQKPNNVQTAVEAAYDLTYTQITRNNMDRETALKWFPFVATLFFFIWWSNIIGYIPLPTNTEETVNIFGVQLPAFAIYAATANVSIPLVLALIVFVSYNVEGIRAKGFIGYLKALVPQGVKGGMAAFIFILEFMSNFMRLISLSVRLFANILAGHLIILFMSGGLAVLLGATFVGWLTLPLGVILFLFEVGLVATLQAFIFATLSAIYLGGAVAEHH
jgi:F-type H+-transporting ATPase subunit a